MIRIIAGALRRRQILMPPIGITRPTTDKVRGAIFNTLTHNDWLPEAGMGALPDDIVVLDLFAGSGAFAFEALSRGALSAWLVDDHPAAIETALKNVEALGLAGRVNLLRADATRLPRARDSGAETCSLVFADPPYGKDLIPPALDSAAAGGWLAKGALIVGEAGTDEDISLPSAFETIDRRAHGDIAIWIWRYGSSS